MSRNIFGRMRLLVGHSNAKDRPLAHRRETTRGSRWDGALGGRGGGAELTLHRDSYFGPR